MAFHFHSQQFNDRHSNTASCICTLATALTLSVVLHCIFRTIWISCIEQFVDLLHNLLTINNIHKCMLVDIVIVIVITQYIHAPDICIDLFTMSLYSFECTLIWLKMIKTEIRNKETSKIIVMNFSNKIYAIRISAEQTKSMES